MVENAYIHIPFCKSKCKYCAFVSFINIEDKQFYINALLKDIDYNYNKEKLKTLYFGGGTPSLLSVKNIEEILDKFNFDSNCEITIEINPDDTSYNYLNELFKLGINRISMGAQTFDDNILKLIGRRHSAKQTIEAVNFAQKAGFSNISLDLIYGLPGEYDYKKDLEIITSLDIQHISTYGLKIEENSFFYNNLPQNLPDDDKQADLYLETNNFLQKLGYFRYEISNFSKLGFESKHNLNYWNNNSYYGFGTAAHGYINNMRYNKPVILKEYLDNPLRNESEYLLNAKEQLEEEIFLGLRKSEGINIEKINKKYNIDFNKKYKQILLKYSPKYLQETSDGYKLTLEGVLLSNNVMSEFLEE